MNPIQFFIEGTPAPGGSKNAFALRRRDGSHVTRPGGSIVINVTDAGGAKNKAWKKTVQVQAKAYMLKMDKGPIPGACKVHLMHILPRPKSHYCTGKNSTVLRNTAPVHHTQKPDALKFGRATEDGLTGALWLDDCQVVMITSQKVWARMGEPSGCFVHVELL